MFFTECSVCGKLLDAGIIPATGHSFGDFQFDVQPSAESAGQKSRHCENCGAVTEVTEVTCLCGDVNGDGIISSKDTKLMKAYLAGQKGDEFIALANADMNSDGMCTSKDIKALKGALV